jgi:hypothetical protein
MASRKELKKSIKNACGELFTDCVVLSKCEGANIEALQQIELKLIAVYNEYVARISHTQKGAEKIFYKKLIADFTETINQLAEDIVKA